MKYPSITFFARTGNVHVTIFEADASNHSMMITTSERIKRIVLHPSHKLQGITWSDIPNHVERYPSYIPVCSQEFADILAECPDEIERIFKHCFINIIQEMAGAEIKDVKITVLYGETQDAE